MRQIYYTTLAMNQEQKDKFDKLKNYGLGIKKIFLVGLEVCSRKFLTTSKEEINKPTVKV